MSKSNADFSAFDFNDSSSDTSLHSRSPFLSGRANSSTAVKSRSACSGGTVGRDNNLHGGNADDGNNPEDDEAATDADSDAADTRDADANGIGDAAGFDAENDDGGNTPTNILGGTQTTTSAATKTNTNAVEVNANNNNNHHNNDESNPLTLEDGLHVISSVANGNINANTANNTEEGLQMATCGNTTTSGASDANPLNCGVAALLDGALSNCMNNSNATTTNNNNNNSNNNNCNELARSSSASLSNNSASTTLGAIGGGGGGSSGHGNPSVAGISTSASDRKKYRHQNYSKNIYIGTKNAERWEHSRTRLQFKNDVEFVAYLLNLADNDTERLANLPELSAPTTPTKSFAGNFKLEPNLSVKEFSNSQTENGDIQPVRKKSKKRVQFSDTINGLPKIKDFSNFAIKAKKHDQKMKPTNNNTDLLPEVLDCRIAEKIKSELEEKTASRESLPNALCLKKNDEFPTMSQRSDDEDDEQEQTESVAAANVSDMIDGVNGQSKKVRSTGKNKKKLKQTMVPPMAALNNSFHGLNSNTTAPDEDDDEVDESDGDDDDEEMDEEALAREMKNEQNFVEEEDEHDIAFRSQQACRECSIAHDYKACPLHNAIGIITDAVDLGEWIERKNLEALAKLKSHAQRHTKHDNDDEDMDETSQMSELETKPLITFAEASVPAEFELHNVEPNVTGVFARTEVRAFTKLGPLIGQLVGSNDVREASDMKWIFEICEAGADKSQLLSCDNPNTSNWLRYIRPAPVYEERNVNLVSIERQAFFVTCRDVKNGMELLYWSDDCNTMWRKKHTEKTNCGGCNLKFEHPLYYRTHCSIFHDPSMSLTIRKYHCKVCGDAVLGKDNIMKHAAEMHEGKGAYQCQFCNKFFLRLNYLEMHRTYGCAANPNRARPLCDFCGRKFCQPQKLKAHIKRMHSDMADVLRDFQCKLCSKLLGSRAALQRHSKEVHSRNSTVVSCPRCQKLFQNRSNLKIHMLTHSGVRPFKCAEPECNAAFTTKQCLQFHYKKVHNYSQEQMPKIERSVAYTFDAYSGGMKVDFLAEQAPRRRRKSLEDQNSLLSSSILDSKSDTEFSDDNIFEAIKKSGKSIKDLCRNEPNLSLLSSKISSIFGEKVIGSRKRKKKNFRANDPKEQPPTMMGDEDDEDERMEHVRRKQNAQLSLVESFLSTTAHRLTAQQQVQQVVAAAAAVSAMAGGGQNVDETNKMHMLPPGLNPQQMAMAHGGPPGLDNDEDDEDDEDDDDEHDGMHPPGQQNQHDQHASYRHHAGIVSPMAKDNVAGMNALGQNLVVSKGSKKWISGDDRHLQRDCASVDRCSMGNNDVAGAQAACGMASAAAAANDMGMPSFAVPPGAVDDPGKLIGQNRDFLARLMSSANANHTHHNANNHEPEDENSSFLDVVESNANASAAAAAAAAAQMAQYHHNGGGNAGPSSAGTTSSSGGGSVIGSATTGNQNEGAQQLQMNALAHTQSFMSSFYNNANSRLGGGAGASASTSASMLVEAALNSVGNMIDNDSNDLKVPNESNINTDSPMGGGGGSQVEAESNRFSSNSNNNNAINSMDNLENELKMMKNLSNFPMQIAPLPMFPNSGQNMNSCNISPDGSTPANPQSNQNQNDVDVDAGSTPRGQHMNAGATDSNGFSSGHHRTPPTPQPISPGRDYGMFGTNGTNASSANAPSSSASSGNSVGNSGNNNISASSPLPTMQSQRRNASSVGSSYPEHELISPASSPSIPRYNFNGDMMRHKRTEVENERRHISGHNQLSSDEENSILPQNSSGQDMRMKFTQSQMDLMYSKYESMANATNLKYNSQELETSEFRNSNHSAANDMSDLQGLDMSSRSNVGASNYHHNFQLPSSASSNISNIGRYHHHIYDILSEREQNQQQQQQSQQQQHHSSAGSAGAQHQQSHASQLAMQQHQSSMHNMLPDQLNDQEHDQTTSVDLSRTANYVVTSPPQLAYNHPHHDMLRMASLDLTPNTNMSVGNNRTFLTSQMQHQSRESLEHHRLLSTVEQHRILAASNAAAADQHRLLVDPTAHLLMEQNNRLLGSADQSRLLGETAQNRHMARGFGAYHQVTSGNYHPGVRPPVLPSPNHHASNPSNYHPFPAYY